MNNKQIVESLEKIQALYLEFSQKSNELIDEIKKDVEVLQKKADYFDLSKYVDKE